MAPAKTANPCLGQSLEKVTVPTDHWAVQLPWKVSSKSLTAYADHHQHTKVYDRRTSPPKVTFDEKALAILNARYHGDPIYGSLVEFREVQTCKSRYVDGILPFIKADGRVMGIFNHNPITLRLAMKDPMLLNLPRIDAEDKASVYNLVKELYVAEPGYVLAARDYSSIEAKIVGYLANDPNYVRVCDIDAHSFLVSHNIKEPADLAWSDADLRTYLAGIKKKHPVQRQGCKKIQHASNYLATAHKAFLEEPKLFGSEREAKRLMDLYYSIFPKISDWHKATCDKVEAQGYITAPSGFRLYYADVYAYAYNKTRGGWDKKFGEQAKEAVAGVPQHMGAYYLLGATVRMCERYPEFSKLIKILIHDEVMFSAREEEVDVWDQRLKEVMEEPCEVMPMHAAWGFGQYMRVATEGKRSIASKDGKWGRWSGMN